ncbi:cell division cycle and apoptosis regulator protein 1-like [Styela clava]
MASGHPKPRMFTGTVTKMHENFGFIDDDVFFQLAVCDGKIPNIGDRVVVEAQYNPNMPFEWNASRVQFVAHQQQSGIVQMQGSHYNANRSQFPQGLKFVSGHGGVGLLGAAPINVINQQQPRIPQPRRQQGGKKRNAQRSAAVDHSSSPRRKSREKDQYKKRRTRTPPKKQSPGNRRGVSADKMPRRPAPRYMIQYAKRQLTRKSSDVMSLKQAFSSLYIPSDVFSVGYNWHKSFTLEQPLSARKCYFHILHKDVETLEKLDSRALSPSDADHTWSAKVMLLQIPNKEEIYNQCCKFAEDDSDTFLHQSRLFKFLVGCKGKKEQMAIGGPWSPSLDGISPGTDPMTLIRTAIRTCKNLTGIDLSNCTQWRRMLEIQYHRGAEVHKGHTIPARVETTVIFLPDVHSCMLSSIEYNSLRTSYIDKCEAVIKAKQEAAENSAADKLASENVEEKQDPDADAKNDVPSDQKETVKSATDVDEVMSNPENEVYTTLDESTDTVEPAEKETNENDPGKTLDSKLDIKSLKVPTLRKELEARGLSPRGLKNALIQRLTNAVEAEEKSASESKDVEMKEENVKNGENPEKLVKEESMQEDEKEPTVEKGKQEKMEEEVEMKQEETKEEESTKQEKTDEKTEDKDNTDKPILKPIKIDVDRIKRHYTLPENNPGIPVHPNAQFKKGNFDCSTTSLSSLLAYRIEDNKESIFEVSVFAEAFYEMLQRQHAFNIYTALSNPLPELKVEEEEKNEEDEDKKETQNDEEDSEPKAKKSKSESEDTEERNNEKGETVDKSEEENLKKEKLDDDKKSDRKRSHSQDSKSSKKTDKSSREKEGKVPQKPAEKLVTLRKDLLLSFVFFDQTQCGYIKASDMNDIIHSIGLGLSRSQISKLLAKYIKRDQIQYRKLIDFPESKLEQYKELLENAEKVDIATLANGNKKLLPSTSVCNGDRKHSMPAESNGIVVFDGTVIDIKSLQRKLSSSEEDRADLEISLEKLKKDLDDTNKILTKTQDEKKILHDNYESTKKRLSETEEGLKSTQDVKEKFEKTLKSIAFSVETVLPEKIQPSKD